MGATNNPFIRKQMLFDIPHRHSVPVFNLARKHLTNSGRPCYGAHTWVCLATAGSHQINRSPLGM